ncbi:MAG: hypothetical protein IPG89_10115 [Bacteroidetes bacterium]|nr:hypothetical protein [Bacteroidota bacterium]
MLKDTAMYIYNKETGISTNNTYFICNDNEDNVWCATRSDGILKITASTCTTYNTDCGLPTNDFTYAFTDKNKNLWFGTADGYLVKYKDAAFELFYFKEFDGNKIKDIDEDSKNNLWLTISNIGIAKFDGKNITCYSGSEV